MLKFLREAKAATPESAAKLLEQAEAAAAAGGRKPVPSPLPMAMGMGGKSPPSGAPAAGAYLCVRVCEWGDGGGVDGGAGCGDWIGVFSLVLSPFLTLFHHYRPQPAHHRLERPGRCWFSILL